MARKDLLKGLMQAAAAPEEEQGSLPRYSRGAIGAVSRGIDDLKRRSISDVAPELIDHAGLHDRLDEDADGIDALKQSIQEYGQQVPVLLRHHPTTEGRYEVVYGRRRVAALKALGLPVKAMVRELDDRSLIIAQGQENSARKDLTFIEKALFAGQMTKMGYDRKVVCDALMIDKTLLSRMLSVVDALPEKLIRAIGSAPSIGRDRWLTLAQRARSADLNATIAAAKGAASDQRFEAVLAALAPARAAVNGVRIFRSETGAKLGEYRSTGRRTVIELGDEGREFGTWLVQNLEEIHHNWLKNKPE